ncbi:MAG: twin transmembrane helix small protein [Betaproteobacteria bacterium]|nr:twin transmembrane helix small protein [Betaproteobacteria bacterium]
MKILIAIAFLGVLTALGSALFFMMRGDPEGAPKTGRMMQALAFRVGISIVLFLCILVSWKMGWVKPTGIPIMPVT